VALYIYGLEKAREKGFVIADTKFEFGVATNDHGEPETILIDEVLTPDSSRFWEAASHAPGSSPASYDKQFIRDYLETVDWDKTPPGPVLPEEIIQGARQRYVDIYQRLTGSALPE
jgi:phosphoribosylaminoimidazole-succinocarboxamide synthase